MKWAACSSSLITFNHYSDFVSGQKLLRFFAIAFELVTFNSYCESRQPTPPSLFIEQQEMYLSISYRKNHEEHMYFTCWDVQVVCQLLICKVSFQSFSFISGEWNMIPPFLFHSPPLTGKSYQIWPGQHCAFPSNVFVEKYSAFLGYFLYYWGNLFCFAVAYVSLQKKPVLLSLMV